MAVLTRVAHACLRLAARRWPVEIRDELLQEWLAELAALDRQPGTAWQRLWFAVSLAASPRAYDEDGALDRPLLSWRGPAGAVVGLLLAGGFGLGLWVTAGNLLDTALLHAADSAGSRAYMWFDLLAAAGAAAVTAGFGAIACRWLGRRHARGSQWPRVWASAVAAVGALGLVLLGWHYATTEAVASATGGGLLLVVAWALVTFPLAVVTSRRVGAGRSREGWVLALAGAPLAATLASAVAAPILTPASDFGTPMSWQITMNACWLLPWTVSAVSFGWASAAASEAETAAKTGEAATASTSGEAETAATTREAETAAKTGAVAAVAAATTGEAGTAAAGHTESPAPAGETASTWRLTAARVLVTVAAAGAAVLWVIGAILLQPLSEPAGWEGENFTYWARELRWAAIMAIVLAVVVCAGARRPAIGVALAGGVGWLAVDVALDRAELSAGTVPLSIAAAAVAVGGCYQAAIGWNSGGREVVTAVDPKAQKPASGSHQVVTAVDLEAQEAAGGGHEVVTAVDLEAGKVAGGGHEVVTAVDPEAQEAAGGGHQVVTAVDPKAAAPNRAGLLVVAGLAAVLSTVAVVTQSPTDSEAALNPGSAAASAVLALVAIGAALSAKPRSSRTSLAVAGFAVVFAAVAPWLLRHWYPRLSTERLLVALGFAALLVLLILVVAGQRPEAPRQWLRLPAVFVAAMVTFPLVFVPAVMAFMMLNVCRGLTALAGNPSINTADSDVVIVLPGALAGLAVGALLTIGEPRSAPRT